MGYQDRRVMHPAKVTPTIARPLHRQVKRVYLVPAFLAVTVDKVLVDHPGGAAELPIVKHGKLPGWLAGLLAIVFSGGEGRVHNAFELDHAYIRVAQAPLVVYLLL